MGSLARACGSSYAVDAVSTHFEEVTLRVNHDKKKLQKEKSKNKTLLHFNIGLHSAEWQGTKAISQRMCMHHCLIVINYQEDAAAVFLF